MSVPRMLEKHCCYRTPENLLSPLIPWQKEAETLISDLVSAAVGSTIAGESCHLFRYGKLGNKAFWGTFKAHIVSVVLLISSIKHGL